MPALFARSFLFTSDAAGVPRSSHFFSLALPAAWFRRIAASLRPTNNTDKSAAGDRGTRHGKTTFLSQSRPSDATACSIPSVPSLSRSHSASSSSTWASNGALSTLRPPIRSQTMCNDNNIIATLKAMQSFVPDSPRTSFIAPFSPDLEAEEGSYPPRPPYVISQPQLYPYTLSDDDIWAEQMVANILADHYRIKNV